MGLDIELPRRGLTIFFVVDTSGSMEGAKIVALNQAFNELIAELREAQEDYLNIQFRVAVLEYSLGARWVTDGSVVIEKFIWPNLEASGVTDFGAACKALNEMLARKAFNREGLCPPVIIVTTDGSPTDDWKAELAVLKQNNWFKYAAKWGIAIGEDANRDVLAAFTGNSETVEDCLSTSHIRKLILGEASRASYGE